MRKTSKRRQAERKGRWAEYATLCILCLKGYQILETRWRCKSGEVDIIARKGGVIAMVEVKARKTHALALDAVTYKNRRRIEHAAQHWIQNQSKYRDFGIRFDIATISGWKFSHLKQAWSEGE